MALRRTDDESVTPAGTAADTSAAPAWLYYVSAALAAVVVVCAGTLVFLFVHDTGGDDSVGDRVSTLFQGDDAAPAAGSPQAEAADVASERDAAMSVADQFVLRVNTYGPHDLNKQNKMPGYVSRVHAVSTAKLQAGFDDGVTLAEQSVSQTGVARTAQLFATGVSTIDGDSATVLVAGSLGQTYPNPKHPKDPGKRLKYEPVPFRFAVKMVKIAGDWKVDDFDSITGEKPTPKPTQKPTSKSTPKSTPKSTQPGARTTRKPGTKTTKGAGR